MSELRAVNPDTGEEMIYANGNWQLVEAQEQAAPPPDTIRSTEGSFLGGGLYDNGLYPAREAMSPKEAVVEAVSDPWIALVGGPVGGIKKAVLNPSKASAWELNAAGQLDGSAGEILGVLRNKVSKLMNKSDEVTIQNRVAHADEMASQMASGNKVMRMQTKEEIIAERAAVRAQMRKEREAEIATRNGKFDPDEYEQITVMDRLREKQLGEDDFPELETGASKYIETLGTKGMEDFKRYNDSKLTPEELFAKNQKWAAYDRGE